MKRKFTAGIILTAFVFNMASGQGFGQAQANYKLQITDYKLGNGANLLLPSPAISHASLKGIKVNPNNPFDLEFIIDTNNDKMINKEEAQVLVNYFFAGLTLPEKDLWVNLSPYEQDRIIPDTTVTTQLGEGLLSQDYLLKQLAASLTYPETELGKKYWDEINGVGARSPRPLLGRGNPAPTENNFNIPFGDSSTTSSPAASSALARSSFTKIWITPEIAKVYENGNSAFITESSLKVLTEEDYLAMQNNVGVGSKPTRDNGQVKNLPLHESNINAFKQYILPQITQQVNQGEHFSQLRQIYNALILGVWFKNKLKDSIYKNYISQSKTKGIDSADVNAKEKIYQQYLNAFKQGAYNYVKRVPYGDNLATTSRGALRAGVRSSRIAYFSGGIAVPSDFGKMGACVKTDPNAPTPTGKEKVLKVEVHLADQLAYEAKVRHETWDHEPVYNARVGFHMRELLRHAEAEGARIREITGTGLDGLYKSILDPKITWYERITPELPAGRNKKVGASQVYSEYTGEYYPSVSAAHRYGRSRIKDARELPDKNSVRVLVLDLSGVDFSKNPRASLILGRFFTETQEFAHYLEGVNYLSSDRPATIDILVPEGSEKNAPLMAHELVEAGLGLNGKPAVRNSPGRKHVIACGKANYGDPKQAKFFAKHGDIGAAKNITTEAAVDRLEELLQKVEDRLGVQGLGNARRGSGALATFDLEPQSAFVAVKVGEQGLQLRVIVESRYRSGLDHDKVDFRVDEPWSSFSGTPDQARKDVTAAFAQAFDKRHDLDGQEQQGDRTIHHMRVVADAKNGRFFFGDKDPDKVFADENIFPAQSSSGDNDMGASVRRPKAKAAAGQAVQGAVAPSLAWANMDYECESITVYEHYSTNTTVIMNAAVPKLNNDGQAGPKVTTAPHEIKLIVHRMNGVYGRRIRNLAQSLGMDPDTRFRIINNDDKVSRSNHICFLPFLAEQDGKMVPFVLVRPDVLVGNDRQLKGALSFAKQRFAEGTPYQGTVQPEFQNEWHSLLEQIASQEAKDSLAAAHISPVPVTDLDKKRIEVTTASVVLAIIAKMKEQFVRKNLKGFLVDYSKASGIVSVCCYEENIGGRMVLVKRSDKVLLLADLGVNTSDIPQVIEALQRLFEDGVTYNIDQIRAIGETAGRSLKEADGGINVTENTINLQTAGKGNDFKVNAKGDFNYVGLVPRVVAITGLSRRELAGMLER